VAADAVPEDAAGRTSATKTSTNGRQQRTRTPRG
jgi:hypothetical protein